MNISDRAMSRQIVTATQAAGVTLPKALSEAFAKTQTIIDGAAIMGATSQSLTDAVVAALATGREPASDPAVQRAVTGNTLAMQGLVDSVQNTIMAELRDECREHAHSLVAAWRKEFNKAARTLKACHQRIGDRPLDDTSSILRQGADIADVWADAKKASGVIERVADAWIAFCMFTGLAQPQHPRHFRPLMLADLEHHELQSIDAGATAWDILIAGHDLSLPSPQEFQQRRTRAEQQRTEPRMVVDEQRSMIAGREIQVPVQ